MKRDLGIIGSSTDSTKVAATVQGMIVMCSALIIMLASRWVHLTPDQVQEGAAQIGLVVGAGVTIFGLIRKLIVWIQGLFSQQG